MATIENLNKQLSCVSTLHHTHHNRDEKALYDVEVYKINDLSEGGVHSRYTKYDIGNV